MGSLETRVDRLEENTVPMVEHDWRDSVRPEYIETVEKLAHQVNEIWRTDETLRPWLEAHGKTLAEYYAMGDAGEMFIVNTVCDEYNHAEVAA